MLLVIDNYDSFTWNLVQGLAALGARVRVERHDAVSVKDVEKLQPARILLSPGPRTPREAGVSMDVVRAFAGRVPILGVCLGHQCIAASYGATIARAFRPMHGRTSLVKHDGLGVYRGLPNPFPAMRYHSLVVDETTLPAELLPTSRSDDGALMGLRHRRHALEGVQFHPESYRTEVGLALLKNFLDA